jgi:hypothetical protein
MPYHDTPPDVGPIDAGPIHDALATLYDLDGALQAFPAWDEAAYGMARAVGLAGLQDSLDTLRRELDPAHFPGSAEWAQACGLIGALAHTLQAAPLDAALVPLRERVAVFLDWTTRLDVAADAAERLRTP